MNVARSRHQTRPDGSYLLMTALGAFYLWRLGLRWRDVRTSPVAVEEAVERDLDAEIEQVTDGGG